MKKLLQGAIILFLFAASISVIEISCSKSNGQANRPQSSTTSATILYSKQSTTVRSALDLFVCNLDGSNVRPIPVSLPSGMLVLNAVESPPALTTNADSVVFTVGQPSGGGWQVVGLYCCAIDGSGLKEVVSGSPNGVFLCDIK